MLNLYIVFVVLKFFSWDRERALLKMGARALLKMGARALLKMGARALLKNGCSSPLKKWVLEPSKIMGARAPLNVEGQPNLSN